MQNDKHRGSLGEKFSNFSAAPSDGLWDAIADSLDEKKKRRGLVWWWLGTGLAAVFFAGVLVYNKPWVTEQSITEHGTDKVQNDLSEHFVEQPKTANGRDELIPAQNRLYALKLEWKKSTDNRAEKNSPVVDKQGSSAEKEKKDLLVGVRTQPPGFLTITSSKTDLALDEMSALAKRNLDRMPIVLVEPLPTTGAQPNFVALHNPVIKNSKWELGVGTTHWINHKNNLPADKPLQNDPVGVTVDTSAFDLVESLNPPGGPKFKSVEKPFGLSLTVAYRLRPNIRFVSGLRIENTRYAAHNSDNYFVASQNDGSDMVFQGSVNVISVGIPVGVEYDFLKLKRFKLGVGADALNEFPILERYRNIPSLASEHKVYNNFTTGYNLAFDANLCISYYLTERLRIQANPGVRWYVMQSDDFSSINLPQRRFWYGGSVGLMLRLK